MYKITSLMNTIFWHSPKAIYMAEEVYINGGGSLGLAAYHSGWAPQLTGLARLRSSMTEQANNLGTTYKTGMTRQVSTLNVLARQPNT